MAPRAKLYIIGVLAVGVGVLASCFPGWQPTAGTGFWLYLVMNIVAATVKVKLPGLPNTISAGFLVLLAAVVQFPRAEVVIMAAAAAMMQCLWRPKRRPAEIQVAFSAASLVISAAAAQAGAHAVIEAIGMPSLVRMIVVAAFLLYTINTGLVSMVVSLVESRALTAVWQQCHLWAFPYYVCGAILLDLTAALDATLSWREVLLMLPIMLLIHVNYRILAGRVGERVPATFRKS